MQGIRILYEAPDIEVYHGHPVEDLAENVRSTDAPYELLLKSSFSGGVTRWLPSQLLASAFPNAGAPLDSSGSTSASGSHTIQLLPWSLTLVSLKSPQGQKKMVWCGHVVPCVDAALVLDNLTTHEDNFSCDRDGVPTCSHIVQPFCLQVHCGVHTSTATIIFGLAQQLAREDKQQVRNKGGIDSTSPTQRVIYEHISRECGCG